MSTTVSTHASNLPDAVWTALREDEASANIILPFAEKASRLPCVDPSDKNQLWIAVYDDAKNVEFVLSCTKGPLGNYPVFIVASKATVQRVQDGVDLADSLVRLARRLLDEVPAQRVFSVFSTAEMAKQFAKIFVEEAHERQHLAIEERQLPYYDATFTSCTKETFNESLSLPFPLRESEDITVALRRADMSHLDRITVLCKAFSETSPPYELDKQNARIEAETMIANEQAWVHVVKPAGQAEEIACLVATTRESANVTAVTKVFTAEKWRRRHCAERLLHRVCQDVLQRKERVVLYVGNSDELAPARRVYHKVGFLGVDANESQGQQAIEGVSKWLEIGFEGTERGYW